MLAYLNISNLAIMERVQVELFPGLTVITGETGSGKSMLLKAVGLLMGGRVTKELCRTGTNELSVEGVWRLGLHAGPHLLEALNLEEGEALPEELVLRRWARLGESAKRERFFVGERLGSAGEASKLGEELLNLSSQHESIRLLRTEEHLRLLDAFGELQDLSGRCAARARECGDLEREAEQVEQRQAWRERRRGELEAVIEDLEGVDAQPGEERSLHDEIERQSHALEIRTALARCLELLYEGEDDTVSRFASVERWLSGIGRFEAGVAPLLKRLSGLRAETEDISAELRHIDARCESDPEELDRMQSRLAQLQKRCRRYGVQDADHLAALLGDARVELSGLEDEDASLEKLRERHAAAVQEYWSVARELHSMRVEAAQRLCKAVKETLALVEMPKATFEIPVVFQDNRVSVAGADHVEFLLSANPGSPPRALNKIASGGELSRVLLALKVVLSDVYEVPTYVFDEIDSGIGGKTSLAVGALLRSLAEKHQVIVVTHTAQIAAYADNHLCVRKSTNGESTWAEVANLVTSQERQEELARMLSGMEDSATALSHAKELMELASAR